MPWDASAYLDDPAVGWDGLSREEKARGREVLFEAYVRSEPALTQAFVQADDARRQEYFAGFVEELQRQQPQKFATPAAVTPEAEQDVALKRQAIAGRYVEQIARERDPQRIHALAQRRDEEIAALRPHQDAIPILDPESEREIARLRAEGADYRQLDDEALARFGPFVAALEPGRGRQMQSEASVRLMQRGVTPGDAAWEGFGEGLSPLTGWEEGRPRAQRRAELERLWAAQVREAQTLRPHQVGHTEAMRQRALEQFDQRPLLEFAYGEHLQDFRPIGTVAAMGVGGVGGARMLAQAGIQPLTRAGVLANALLVDAPLGALYAKTAPGYLAGLAASLTGNRDLEGNEVINALENAGIGYLFGAALRQGAIGEMMGYARKHLGFAGETVRDFRGWIDEMKASRARAVHTEPVSRQLGAPAPEAAPARSTTPEPPPVDPAARGQGAPRMPQAEPEAPPAPPEPSSAAQFLARREAMRIPEQIVQGGTTTVLGARGVELPGVYVYAPRALVHASHLGETFSRNPAYPLENTRDYTNLAEQEKVLGVRNAFDVRRHVTDSPDAAVGPAVIAHVVDEQGASRLVVLGGNNREMAISMLKPEMGRELDAYTASRAERFGLPAPEPGQALYRFVGDFDLRDAGVRERLQGVIDALNPAPGKVQNLSEMAGVDAGNNVPLPRLQAAGMNMPPGAAQDYVRALIRDGSIDRNLRSSFAESPAQAQSYVNHLLLHGAYRIPSLVEAHMDSRAGEVGVVRAMVDAGVPAALELRALGREDIADALGRTFYQVARQVQAGQRKLPKILDDLARQGDLDPAMQVVQDLSGALARKVQLDKRGSVRVEPTAEGIEALVGDIGRALSLQGREADLFGAVPDAGETIRRAIAFHFDRLEAPAAPGVVQEPAVRVRPMAGADSVPGYVAPRPDVPRETRPMAPANYVGRWDPGVPGVAPIEYFALRTPDGGITHTTAAAIEGQGYYLPAALPEPREWTGAGDSAGVPLRDDRAGQAAATALARDEYRRLSKRLQALRREGAGRDLTAAEHAEIDAIERALGQQFLDFYVPKEAPPPQPSKGRGLADDRQMSLFERHKRYREAANQLYLDLGNELDALARGEAGGVPGGGGAAPRLDAGRRPAATLRGLAWTRALASDGIVRFVGAEVTHLDDLARLAQTLRNPQFETFYVVGLKGDRVLPPYAVSSRLPDQAAIFVEGGSAQDIIRHLRAQQAERFFFLHNHPSGNVEPSWADRDVTGALARIVHQGLPGARFDGHIVINHLRYTVIEWDAAEPHRVAEYERELPEARQVPDRVLAPEIAHPGLGAKIGEHAGMAAWGAKFAEARDGWVDTVLMDTKGRVRAVLEVHADDVLLPQWEARLRGWAREYGASRAAVFARTQGRPELKAALTASVERGVLLDAVFDGAPRTLMESRAIAPTPHNPLRLAASPLDRPEVIRVQEGGEPPRLEHAGRLPEAQDAPEAHVWVRTAEAGRTGDYLPMVFRDLEKIRTIEMPEMVALAETLMGRLPRLRRLPQALGIFQGAGSGRVSLDPRIFARSDVAARVLAHELGHLADFLPDKTLARGNLLGRIATLRNYMAQTIDLVPTTPSQALTPVDRGRLRRGAEKGAGPRPPESNEPEVARWRADVKERYERALEAELKRRGLTTQQIVFDELWGLSQWWKPVPEGAPQSFLEYRRSAPELYADAISVLFNSPADLMERAPTFWRTWFAYLDRKPEVKKAFFELQDLLQKPYREVLDVRRQRVHGMFVRGEERLRRAWEEREAHRGQFRGWWDRVKQEIHDIYTPIIRRARAAKARGAHLEPKWDPEYIFGEHPLGDARAAVFAQRVHEKVVAPLEAAGMETVHLGRFMFYNRVLNEVLPDRGDMPGGRAQLANPLGETPATARLALLEMRLSLGMENMETLEGLARRFQELIFEQAREAVELGNYPAAALETLEANRYNYATFAVLDHFEPYVPAGIKAQKGTFAGIANPFTATLLKGLSMIRANQLQVTKLTAVKLLRDFFPAEIRERTKGAQPRAGEGTLRLMANGRPVEMIVPADVARMWEGITPANASAVVGALNWGFRVAIYPLWITYNPAFQLLTSPLRDIGRSVVNMPRGHGFRMIGEYLANLGSLTLEGANAALRGAGVPAQIPVPMTQAARAARAVLGQDTEPGRAAPGAVGAQDAAGLAREMMLNSAIGTPYDAFATHRRGDALGQVMRQLRLLPQEPRTKFWRSRVMQPVLRLAKAIEFAGITNELLAKTSAYRILTKELGRSPREAAEFVRNNVGVPNIHKQGRHTRLIQAVFPFFNVFQKGLAADYALATGRTSAGGWWFRWAATSGLPSMLQALARIGAFGAAVKLLYDRIGEYDNTNYTVLPVGEVQGGDFGAKTVYVRIPRDETQRLMSGMLYKAIVTAGGEPGNHVADLIAFGSGQVPGLNPLVNIGTKWTQYLAGTSPRDDFRDRDILAPQVQRAGGWPATRDMLLWTYNETGLSHFLKIDPLAQTTLEYSLQAAPGVNRLLKVSDYGLRERQFAELEEVQALRARERLRLGESVRRNLGEYYTLQRLREQRSPEQEIRYQVLNAWVNKTYRPLEEGLFDAVETGDSAGAAELRRDLDAAAEAIREVIRPR